MKLSKILITIGLVLSIIAFIMTLTGGFISYIGIVLLSVSLWYYFKESNINKFALAFIIIGAVYIILDIPSRGISINGIFYLIGGIVARNGK